MKELLKEISVLPGVAGTCVFDKNAGEVCSGFKTNAPDKLAETLGDYFVRLFREGSKNRLDIKTVHFHFDRYKVFGLSLDPGAVMLAVCESGADFSLVAAKAEMLTESMRDELKAVQGRNGG